MSNEISLSLEETNKLRLSLGLKPIIIETRDESEVIQEPIKHTGKSLVRPSDGANSNNNGNAKSSLDLGSSALDDTDDWLAGLTTSKISAPVVRADDKPEEVHQAYSSEELNGIKVGHSLHDVSKLQDGVILTLKDDELIPSDGDDNAQDELISEQLVAKKTLEDNLKAKAGKDKARYKGYNDDEPDPTNGIKEGSFTLTGGAANVKAQTKNEDEESELKNKSKKRVMLSDSDIDEDEENENDKKKDYQEVKMKKFKKREKHNGTKRAKSKLDDSLSFKERDLQYVELTKAEDVMEDDADLRMILAAARKKKNQQYQQPQRHLISMKQEAKEEEDGGFTIDETTEFLNKIGKEQNDQSSSIKQEVQVKQELDRPIEEDYPLEKQPDSSVKTEQEEVPRIKTESEVEMPISHSSTKRTDESENEEDVGNGLGSALRLLQQRAMLEKQDIQSKQIKQEQRSLLQQRSLLEAQRRLHEDGDDADSSSNGKELRKIEIQERELLKNYNPVVNLKYYDEAGNSLNTKEAYKQLSHQFHGKAPSNNKIAKLNRKRQQQKGP